MGSLDRDGLPLTRTNHSYRNIGRAITANQCGVTGDLGIDLINQPLSLIAIPSYDNGKEIVCYGNTIKTTNGNNDTLVERQFSVSATGYPVPSIAEEKVQYTTVYQGSSVKITQSNADTLIDRNFN